MMTFDTFLSHNGKDKAIVGELADALIARGLRPWLDELELVPGRPWLDAIGEVILKVKTACVLFGPSGIGPWEAPEMRAFLSQFITRGLPVIPVLLPRAPKQPELPLFLQAFTWVDLRGGLNEEGLDRLVWGITGQKPGPSGRPGGATPRAPDIDLPTSGEFCFGREDELELLTRLWRDGGKNIVSIVARGGEGKTTLVTHWLDSMANDDFRGAELVFARSFYSQGTSDRAASADKVIDEALRFFGEEDPEQLSPQDRGRVLAKRVGAGRNILVLDGMEPLQYPPGEMQGEIKDPALETLLKSLRFFNRGLCIVTTREEIRPLQGSANHEEIVLKRLDTEAARQLLAKLGVHGDPAEIEKAIEENQGHALAITLLGTYLSGRYDGDIAHIQRISYPPGYEDKNLPAQPSTELLKGREREAKHARKMIASYEKWFQEEPDPVNSAALVVLRFMGLFNRPPEPGCIQALRKSPIEGLSEALFTGEDSKEIWRKAVSRLVQARLLERSGSGWNNIDCHPLIREYFADQLEKPLPFWKKIIMWIRRKPLPNRVAREAHRRIYEFLKSAAPDLPDNLHDMMPLCHAVAHGGKGGLWQESHDEVYLRRIRRGREDFCIKKLGAYGAGLAVLSCFFKRCWDQPIPHLYRRDQAILLGSAGYHLRALGHLRECAAPMQTSLELIIEDSEWEQAAVNASNLSELSLTLGDVMYALRFGEQSVELADRSCKPFQRLARRATLADAHLAAGRSRLAAAALEEAEALQKERQPESPLLYSLAGFRFCRLLVDCLEEANREGKESDQAGDQPTVEPGLPIQSQWKTLQQVKNRAETTLKWMTQQQLLLDMGLDHLTLGRIWLLVLNPEYEFRPSVEETGQRKENLKSSIQKARFHLGNSVSLLRRAGTQHHLPRGLLQRAALWRVLFQIQKDDSLLDQARRDLEETEEIASRGPMLIFQIEAALERTRLALALDDPELAREKLNQALALIKKTEKPYVPHVPDWKKWQPPDYVGRIQAGEIVGYHRRNGEISRLEKRIQALSDGKKQK